MQLCCKFSRCALFCNIVASFYCMEPMRKTKSLKKILKRFEDIDEALSVVDLIDGLHSEMSKTTVYRILDRLEEAGFLHSFIGNNGRKWYAKCQDCFLEDSTYTHPHFQCKNCGKVECLPMEIAIPLLPKHKINSAEFLLVGECVKCQAYKA